MLDGFVGQHTECDEIVFGLPKRGDDCLFVERGIAIELGQCLFLHAAAAAAFEEGIGQAGAKGVHDACRAKYGLQRVAALKAGAGTEDHGGVEGRLSDPNRLIAFLRPAFRRGNIRPALQQLRGQADGNGRRLRRDGQRGEGDV